MEKNKSAISMIIVVILLFSLTGAPIFADEPKSTSALGEYLASKGYNDTSSTTMIENDSTSAKKEKLSSDGYIQTLIDKGIKFEVKDKHYKKADKMKPDELKNKEVIDINGEKYVKVKETLTVNAMPVVEVAAYAQGDTNIREVTNNSFQTIDSLEDNYEQFASGFIFALAGYSHPVSGFITALAGLFPYPVEQYGWVLATTTNQYYYTNVWYEVYDIYGFIPMVITESRQTNVNYNQKVVNKLNGYPTTKDKWFTGIYYEYSYNFGYHSLNLAQAVNMYNAGLRTTEVYQYWTGGVVDNTYLLP